MEKEMERNIIETIHGLLKQLSIPVHRSTIVTEVKNSKNKNLYGISELLSKWKIPNAAGKLNHPDELRNEFCPLIAHINTGISESAFALVKKIDDRTLIVSNEYWKNKSMTRDKFAKICTGTFLFVEPDEHSGELDYKGKNRQVLFAQSRTMLALSSVAILTLWFFSQAENQHWGIAALFLLKCIGLLVSVFLVIPGFEKNNPYVARLCSNGTQTNTSCDDVLSSPEAKVFSWLSLAEIGLLYFSCTLLALLFRTQSAPLLRIFFILSIANLPVIVYSLSIQAFVLKKWCKLCCTVQLILLLEFITLLFYIPKMPRGFTLSESLGFILCLAAPVVLWSFIKPLLLKSGHLESAQNLLWKFKQNNQLFKRILADQPVYALPDEDVSIIIGKEHSNNIITFVSNPFCTSCSEAYKALNEWLMQGADIQVRVMFTNIHDRTVKAVRHLITIAKSQGGPAFRNALNDWYLYGKKNRKRWIRNFPIEPNLELCDQIIERQIHWCNTVGVSYTPLITINGHRLPDGYRLEDLKYLI
jgi:uncharacterized membrane protein